MKAAFRAFVALLMILAACSGADAVIPDAGPRDAGRDSATAPTPPSDDVDDAFEAGKFDGPRLGDAGYPNPNGIPYRGGAVMTQGMPVYLIWYGSWREATKALVREFVAGLGQSEYFAINRTYYDSKGRRAAGVAYYMGDVDLGWELGDAGPWADTEQAAIALVSLAIARAAIPPDEASAYVVLVSKEQAAYDSPCLLWCAWHDRFSLGILDLKIALAWDPAGCPHGCTGFDPDGGYRSPNGDLAADGLANLIAHELDEIESDPDIDGWRWPDYTEGADMCSWTWGPAVYAADGGAPANVRFGDRDWLVQQNWANADGGYCTLRLQ